MSEKIDLSCNVKTIDGNEYAKMLYGGAAMLQLHADEINDLNVFPVPDGDTGTNMTSTVMGGLSEIDGKNDENIGKLSGRFAHGVLLGARGNSGVILSQIFAGIGDELSRYEKVGAHELADAYKKGIERSYAAVQNPTEGTILTVFREATEYAAAKVGRDSSVEDFFRLHIEEAKRSLENTKEILPVLAEADVVDSGGAGYLYMAIGMYEALTGKLPEVSFDKPAASQPKVDIDMFTRDSVLEFGYCTEFLLRLTTSKVDPDSFDISTVTELLDELKGESVVAYKTDDIVKVHVHTFNPGEVLSRMQSFGEFLTVKIENMSVGHSESEPKKKKPAKKYEVVAVASGDGMHALFEDMGADVIVDGGQSKTPSTEDFIKAFDKCSAENIIVFPNNKNIILAANQAKEIYEGANIHIIPTKNLMQCYGALSVITPGITDIDALIDSINRAASDVLGFEVTEAVRDVTLSGKEIRKGDFIAISGSEIPVVSDTAENAVKDILAKIDMDDYEIITLFVGKRISDDDRVRLTEELKDEYPDCEIEVFISGQDIYDYMIAVE